MWPFQPCWRVQKDYLIGKPPAAGGLFPERDHPVIHTTLAQLNQEFAPDHPVLQTWEPEICPRQAPPVPVAVTLSCKPPAQWHPSLSALADSRTLPNRKTGRGKNFTTQAFHDSLTDLPNRALLNTYLPKALAQAKRHNTPTGPSLSRP